MIKMPGVGPARAKALSAAGIDSLQDLLYRFPVDFRDYTNIRSISGLLPGDRAAFRAEIMRAPKRSFISGLSVTSTRVADGTGEIECVWYNQPYIAAQLIRGTQWLMYGSVSEKRGMLQVVNPVLDAPGSLSGLQPVYKPIPGVPQKLYREMVAMALHQYGKNLTETLPEDLLERYQLIGIGDAVRFAHLPPDFGQLTHAKRRLSFEELFFYQLALSAERVKPEPGIVLSADFVSAAPALSALPFALTGAQKRVMQEIYVDLSSERAMARLVQGDVGSGKTALAYLSLYAAWQNGYQGALMAPTEILARQHYEGAQRLLAPLGLRIVLLTGALSAAQHKETLAMLHTGEADVAIGTHALISEGVSYHKLGLAITDEQHRFGVRQRTSLQKKSGDTARSPNVLVMSATPIPRTLALILYGDLDISVIDELPPGRTPVRTYVVPEEKREGMYGFLQTQLTQGGQAYIVCPLVEESEAMEEVSAQQRYEELAVRYAAFGVGLTHGRQRAQDKAQVLDDFAQGKIGVLVSTTVIEVGVNVPNANVMVIEGADRFGLSQLHQLRGRVGRGERESYCFLMGKGERLRVLAGTNDGFVIAQKDLEMRGPGELLGTRQHGAIDGRLAALAADAAMLAQANAAAREILSQPDAPQNLSLIDAAQRRYAEKIGQLARN